MKKIMKKYGTKKIITKTTDNAVVGIVTAILIIGLIVSVISIVQTIYVPKIMEQREAEHMDEVAAQFASLTSVIGDQAADGRRGVPIATFLTLGSRELPYLVSSKAFGSLEILDNSCSISVTNESSTKIYPTGTIAYSSNNAYFLDQSYTYEVGAMIISQSEGNLMMIPPGFFVNVDRNTQIVNISFDVVNISSVGQKIIAAGFGTYPIQTEFCNISTNVTFTDVHNMTIATPYTNAWSVFLHSSLMKAGFNSEETSPQFVLVDTGQILKLDFPSTGYYTVNIFLKIINIQAQIGPGWVE